MNECDSVICALRHCASGAKFPGQCGEDCPLFYVKAEENFCVSCIDNMLTKAADLLEHGVAPGKTQPESDGKGHYPFLIRETHELLVSIEADSYEEARRQVEDRYDNDEFDLERNCFAGVEFLRYDE